MIQSISLKNFKQHSSLNVDFTRGVNVITGENFAGKSSLLHALLYAWWGSTAVPGGQKIVQKRGTSSHAVEVSWSEGEDTYHIKRTVSVCNLWKNGKEDEHLVATGASAVGAKLEELFGMDRAEFCDIKYAEQKKAEQMLTLGASRVHSLIEKIVDAQRVNTVIDRAKSEGQRIAIQLETMPTHDMNELLQTKEAFDTMLKGHVEGLPALEAEHKKAVEDRDKASTELNLVRTKSQLMVQAISRYFELQRELKTADDSLQSTVAKLNSRPTFPPIEQIREAIVATQKRIDAAVALDTAWVQYEQQHEVMSQTLKTYQQQHAECEETLKGIPLVHEPEEALQHLKSALEFQVQQNRDEKAVAMAAVTQLQNGKSSAVCHACKRAFEGHNLADIETHIQEEQMKVVALTDAAAVLSTRLAECNTKLGHIQNLESARYALETAQKNRDAAAIALEELIKPTSPRPSPTLTAQLKEQVGTLTQQEKDASIEQVTVNSLGEWVKEHARQKTDLSLKITNLVQHHGLTAAHTTPGSTVTPFKEEIDSLQAKVRNLDAAASTASSKVTSSKESIAGLKEKISSVSDKILLAQQTVEEKTRLIKRADLCKRLGKFLRDNKDAFLAEVWGKITAYATAVARTCTGGKITEVVRTSDGKFEYWEDDEVFPVEAASGAQRSIMGLGVQLALAQMLPSGFSTMLLDEPTADMSETVSMSLATLLSQSNSQVLMVSHRELDGTVSDNSIHL